MIRRREGELEECRKWGKGVERKRRSCEEDERKDEKIIDGEQRRKKEVRKRNLIIKEVKAEKKGMEWLKEENKIR